MTLDNIAKQYGKRSIVKEMSLTIHRGECIIIRGKNGAGKSTLLQLLAGIIPVSRGRRILSSSSSSSVLIGYAPDRLSPLRLTSTEYLTHIGSIAGMAKLELQQRIRFLHESLSLEQSATMKMIHFSKGMLQKVNMMQAMLQTPQLLVLDEPFSGLDQQTMEHILASLAQLKLAGTAIVAAVHDPYIVQALQDRTFWLTEGQVVEVATEPTSQTTKVVFILQCRMKEQDREELAKMFPHSPSIVDEQDMISCTPCISWTIRQQDYRLFLLEFTNRGYEVIKLERQELVQ